MRKDSEGQSAHMCMSVCVRVHTCTHMYTHKKVKQPPPPLNSPQEEKLHQFCVFFSPKVRDQEGLLCSPQPAWDTALLLQCTMANGHHRVPAPLSTFLPCGLCTE